MEVDTRFIDILVSPEFQEYTDYCMIVRGKPFLIKFPVDVSAERARYLHALANAKVYQRVYYKPVHKTSPQKRGRKSKWANRSEENHAYYERRKSRLAKSEAPIPVA
jgi:hypothetical protein